MKRVEIQTFAGEKLKYEEWKAAFIACVGSSPATPEYKFLQMKQFLSGEALQAVANFGYTQGGYEAAKARLDKQFGGERRQVARCVEELERVGSLSGSKAAELERFADLLEVAVVNLQDAGHTAEHGAGTFYMTLLRKLSEQLLTQYQRWLFDNRRRENVLALLEWASQEAEFLTRAKETVRGLAPRHSQKPQRQLRSHTGSQRQTYVVNGDPKTSKCPICLGGHVIWHCTGFEAMDNSKRWAATRRASLCFRCLGLGHRGHECRRGWMCGVNGCRDTHHRLLHSNVAKPTPPKHANPAADSTASPSTTNTQSCHTVQAAIEGETQSDTVLTSRTESRTRVAIRTVPVILSHGKQSVRVNALLDDASTTSYINTGVAAQLGVSGAPRRSTVSTLNGKIDTFMTTPVTFHISSDDGAVQRPMTAYSTDKVTGSLRPVDWVQEAKKYDHLREIPFPDIAEPAVVGLPIGCDHAEFIISHEDIAGPPGQPVARRTPLGWTCIGRVRESPDVNTHFGETFLVRDVTMTAIDSTLQRFWEVESCGLESCIEPGPMSADEEAALKVARQSLKKVDGRYQVAIPWNSWRVELHNNEEAALKRLVSTERRLHKDENIAMAYKKVVKAHEEKGYIRQLSKAEAQQKKCWYLPHFAIVRPQKTITKVRIVFDAAANCGGLSLNDAIFPGTEAPTRYL